MQRHNSTSHMVSCILKIHGRKTYSRTNTPDRKGDKIVKSQENNTMGVCLPAAVTVMFLQNAKLSFKSTAQHLENCRLFSRCDKLTEE
jgi:hypothetical protein